MCLLTCSSGASVTEKRGFLYREYYRGKYHYTIVPLFDWFGLDCLQIKTKIVSCHTADSKPVKQEVNSTVILPPLAFPGLYNIRILLQHLIITRLQ